MACAGAAVAGALAMACGSDKVVAPPFGPPTKLAFLQQASGASGGSPFATQPTVAVLDANGNRVLTVTVTVHVAIGTNPATGTLSGTVDAAARNGVASFSGLAIDKAASGYTLIATAPGLTSATSEPFEVVVGPPARIGIVTQPAGASGGAAFTTQPVFEIVDRGGNRVVAATAQVTVAIGANPASGTLSGTTTVTPQNGLATFAGLKIDKAGTGYGLTASATGLTSVTTAAFDVVVGPAAQLNFAVHPVGGPGGLPLPTQPNVEVTDLGGNRVTASTASVTVSFGTNRGNGTLSGTLTLAAVSGLASFTDLSVDKAASGYTLVAKTTGLDSAVSAAFAITVGVPAKVLFATQPVGGPGGGAFATQPTVEIADAGGNRVTTSTAAVTVALGANAAGGTLTGTLTVNAVAGLASFTNLSLDKAGSGYTLVASSGTLASATSAEFAIIVGAAFRLAFVTQPGGATGGTAFATQPTVEVQDAGGNRVTTDTSSVSVNLGSNPSGGALLGTRTVAAVAGLASYTNLAIDRTGSGYTLVASSPGLQPATSDSIAVSLGVPSQLRFVTQPGGAAGGTPFTTQPTVELLDAGGNRVTVSTASVSIALGSNPNSGTLSGTVTVSAVAGLASFTDLAIDRSGGGYTLVASSTGVTDGVSATFGVAVGAPTRLNFSQQPSNGTGGTALPTQPRVEVLDAGGNRVTTSTASVTLAFGANVAGGTLSGTLTVSATLGIANFAGLSIDRAGTGYALAATSAGLTGATSASFDITVGAPAKLAFITQPTGAVGGIPFTTQPVVEIEDAGGNRVTTSTATVNISIADNPAGGVLSGTRAVAAVAGVVTYTNLSIDKAGSGYTLVASGGTLTSATSSAFGVAVGAAITLRFATQPGGATGGTAFATQPAVEVIDAGGNRVTSSTASITLALFDNPGAGTLSGTITVSATAGLATFSNLAIDRTATGYTLIATASGLLSVTSALFDVAVGAAARLAFAAEPGGATGGSAFSGQPVVQILDAGGNLASTSTASVTVAIGTNPSGGTLAGTVAVSALGGIATFTDLAIDRAGAGYTLVATSTGLTNGTSAAFSVAVGSAAALRFTTEPSGAVGGAAFATQPAVEVVDAGGNRVTASTASVTIVLGANPIGGTLSGTTTRSAALGVASFAGLAIDLAGSGYTLVASSSGLTNGTSAALTVAVGAATAVRFVTQPGGATGGSAFGSQPAVEVVDAGGNRVTTSSATVMLAVGPGSPVGVLSGAVTLSASAGLATFSGLSIDLAGSAYTLVASSGALASATS
ncbi:MAG: hemagglutinin, partial [Gemmatimonadetes bacterium]|nr:hemagglutinin [Gemmatimonadota bacterium]